MLRPCWLKLPRKLLHRSAGLVVLLLVVLPVGAVAQGGATALDSSWVTPAEAPYLPPDWVRKIDLRNARDLPRNLHHYPKLEAIHLGNAELKTLPAYILKLRSLKAIYLDRTWELNHVQAIGLLAQMPGLRRVSLRYCDFKQAPEAIGQLRQIHALNLELNQLSALPASLPQLSRLRSLRIGMNPKLTRLPQQVLQLPHLERLYLDNCPIASLPEAIASRLRLSHLSLSGTRIERLPESFRYNPHLKRLNLSYCRKIDWPRTLQLLSTLPNLQVLKLNQTDIRDLRLPGGLQLKCDTLYAAHCLGFGNLLPALQEANQLKMLDLSETRLSESELKQVMRLSQLEVLNLNSLDLTELPEEIQLLRDLRIISLQYNDLAAEDFSVLAALPRLEEVRVSFGKYGPEDLQAIQEAVPGVRISY